jgi:hypothetical protein
MHKGEFISPDVLFEGKEVPLPYIPIHIIHLLARRAPNIIYGFDGSKRKQLDQYIAGLRDI